MKKEYKIKAKVWLYPGLGGWHFVNIDKKISADIRKVYPKGFVKIRAQIGKTAWDTSLFPHKESSSYLLSIKKSVRAKEDILDGDEIKLIFRIKDEN
jgi:hypothetical protein